MKTFLKKAWIWTKKHWYFPVLGLFLLVAFALCPFLAASDNKFFQMFRASRESYKKEIDVINKAEEEKSQKQSELYNTYLETLKKLQKEHDVNVENLEKEKMIKLDKMVKEYKGSPEDLAKDLGEMFGVDYVE
jgi:predicted GTPase